MAPRRFPIPHGAVVAVALLSVAAVVSSAHAVIAPWTVASSGAGIDVTALTAVTTFPDGTSVTAGYFRGAGVELGDGVPRTSTGGGTGYSAVVQKISADGRVLWVRVATGGTVTRSLGVAPRADGGVTVTGYAGGTGIDFGDGITRTAAANGGGESAFVEAIAGDGSVRWVALSNAPVQNWTLTYGNALAAMPDGGALVAGDFQGVGVDLGDGIPRTSSDGGVYGRYSSFIQRRAADGSVAWTTTSTSAGAAEVTATGATSRPDGTAVVVGYFTGVAVDLGDGVVRASAQAGASKSAFMQALSPRGGVLWTRTSSAGGSSRAEPRAVGALPDDGFIVTGSFRGDGVDLGDGIARTSAGGGAAVSVFTQRRGSDGSVAWTRVSTGGGATEAAGLAVSTLPDGSAWVGGDFQGVGVDLGDGVSRTSGSSGVVGNYSSFVQKRNPDGRLAWTRASTAPVQAASDAGVYGISAQPDGTAVTGGAFRGTGVDLGDGIARTSAAGGASYSLVAQQLMDVPVSPLAPVATPGDGRAVVGVTPVAGTAVTAYGISARPGAGRCTITPPATSCAIGGLANGRSYAFTATATNAAGSSSPSPASTAVVPTAPARALVAQVLIGRTRLVSGQSMTVRLRVHNTGASAMAAVTACTRLPTHLVLMRRNGALRSGRTLCFRMGDLPARSGRMKAVLVRAVAARGVRVVLRARATSVAITPRTSSSRPVAVRIVPRDARTGVAG